MNEPEPKNGKQQLEDAIASVKDLVQERDALIKVNEELKKIVEKLARRCTGRRKCITSLNRALEHSEERRRTTIEAILRVLKPEQQQQVMTAVSVENVGLVSGMLIVQSKGKP